MKNFTVDDSSDVLQEEEVCVPLEVLEQSEEVPVADEGFSHVVRLAEVVQVMRHRLPLALG